jgi:hypothetical protein
MGGAITEADRKGALPPRCKGHLLKSKIFFARFAREICHSNSKIHGAASAYRAKLNVDVTKEMHYSGNGRDNSPSAHSMISIQ